VGLTRVGEMTLGNPCRISAAHEVDEVRVVHGDDRRESEVRGFEDPRACAGESVVQHIAAFGLLLAGLPHAEPVATVGRMAAMPR
jgi:hypothetical protein